MFLGAPLMSFCSWSTTCQTSFSRLRTTKVITFHWWNEIFFVVTLISSCWPAGPPGSLLTCTIVEPYNSSASRMRTSAPSSIQMQQQHLLHIIGQLVWWRYLGNQTSAVLLKHILLIPCSIGARHSSRCILLLWAQVTQGSRNLRYAIGAGDSRE